MRLGSFSSLTEACGIQGGATACCGAHPRWMPAVSSTGGKIPQCSPHRCSPAVQLTRPSTCRIPCHLLGTQHRRARGHRGDDLHVIFLLFSFIDLPVIFPEDLFLCLA